jgi:hypothetical protein
MGYKRYGRRKGGLGYVGVSPAGSKKFLHLYKVQHPPGPPGNSTTAINLNEVRLGAAAYSALSKGLNYAVALGPIAIKD